MAEQSWSLALSDSEKIPKIIHYCWFGGAEKPEIVQKCIASWRKFLPDYEIMEWNDSHRGLFDNSYFKSAFENEKWAFASDYARFKVLYDFGGIYLDTDEEIFSDFDAFLNFDVFLGFENYGGLVSPMGGVIGAKKASNLVGEILETYSGGDFQNPDGTFDLSPITARLRKYFREKHAMADDISGYEMFEFGENSIIFPADYFCEYAGLNTVAMHHYAFSWKKDVLLRKYLVFEDDISKKCNLQIYFLPKKEFSDRISAKILFKINFFSHVLLLVMKRW